MMLSRKIIYEPIGSRFHIQSARDVIGFDQSGWVVTDRRTGLSIWTGSMMTINEAADRLLLDAKAMDGLTEHEAPRGAAQSGSEQGCDSMPAKAMAPRTHTAPPFETLKGLQFFAKDSDGQWHYVNHAGTWQTCPPPA